MVHRSLVLYSGIGSTIAGTDIGNLHGLAAGNVGDESCTEGLNPGQLMPERLGRWVPGYRYEQSGLRTLRVASIIEASPIIYVRMTLMTH